MKKLLILFVAALAFMSCEVDPTNGTITTETQAIWTFHKSHPLKVAFENMSTNASDFVWDFGDGRTSTEKNPVHKYASAGTYLVKLTAKKGSKKSESAGEVKVTAPDYCYVSGITYNKVQYDSKYYTCKMYDGSVGGLVFETNYHLLSNSVLPKTVTLSPSAQFDYKNRSKYTVYVNWANNASGSGKTQTMCKEFYKADVLKYPESITLTNDPGNTQVVVNFVWK